MEFLSKSMEINGNLSGELLVNFLMESLRIPININGNWSGELLANFAMESLRNSFQYQWKLVWRALGQFPNEILREFLSISMEICLERIRMEVLSKLMEIGLESSWAFFQWNP